MVQTHFFSHGVSFELPESLCSFPPDTKDQLVLEAMSNDSCLLDLKGTLSARRQPGSSETLVSLATSAPSAFHEEFGEHVSDGVLEGPSRFAFLLPPTSKDKSPTLQKPFHKLFRGAERVAHGRLPLLL